ncbi:MAG: MFS transporter [Ruminococcus sp.]|jgi:MFS family permease
MKITGIKRWVLLIIVSIFAGTMVITPYLRFNYYDQIVILLTQSHPIVDPAVVNEYIGDLALVFGAINMVMYIVGGLLVDKFGERIMLVLGGLMMAGGSVLYGLVLSRAALMAGFILLGFGQGTMWGGYLKLTRKLGNASEQGRMYSTSEFIRGITGTCLGLLGVAILNQAILPSGTTDPVLIGEKWRIMLLVHAGIYIVSVILCLILVPKNVIGAEEDEAAAAEPFTLKGAAAVLKLPGTWLATAILFFGYSITACASGYLGAYTSNVIGVSASQAATFAIIRNYFIAAISTFAIGYVAVKLKSESKTIGLYSLISGILIFVMLLSAGNFTLCIASTFIFAIAYTGMRGLYFAVPSEVGIPVRLTGVTTGIMSLIGYLPDVFFAKLAGRWLDQHGLAGYNYIWYWGIGCALLGAVVCFASYRYAKKHRNA